MLKKVNKLIDQKYFFKFDNMSGRNRILNLLTIGIINSVSGQNIQIQQGVLIKAGTNDRLSNVQIFNKRNLYKVKSNGFGLFSIVALPGDTLEVTLSGYNLDTAIVKDFAFKYIYLKPSNYELHEVVITGSSLKQDLLDAQNGYRKKSVFYTGTPHYYYLFLKPMTFIYENFKSEVLEARKFKKFAKSELDYDKIYQRFNDYTIKKYIPIKDEELNDFKSAYMPTLKQIELWNDYEIGIYIKKSYQDFTRKRSEKPKDN